MDLHRKKKRNIVSNLIPYKNRGLNFKYLRPHLCQQWHTQATQSTNLFLNTTEESTSGLACYSLCKKCNFSLIYTLNYSSSHCSPCPFNSSANRSMHVLKQKCYYMFLTDLNTICSVTLQENIAVNTRTCTHTDAITVIQETQADFHKSSNSVDVEAGTKGKLYPVCLSVTHKHTGISKKFFQGYERWTCQSEVSRAKEAVIGKPCSPE